MAPFDYLYLLLIGFIRSVKWIEFQILRLFSPLITKQWLKSAAELGVILHLTEESYKNWSPEDEKEALAKCAKYDKIIHIKVFNKNLFLEASNSGNWGMGQGYINRWYDCSEEDVAEYCKRSLENGILEIFFNWWNRFLNYLEFELFNLQTRARAMEVITKHYDLGNEIYEATLDPYMQYTCGYWLKAKNLDDAQLDKLDLIARKLNLKPGMRVLDIGCGWGMLCKFLAERYKVECVGVTISKEGAEYSRKACKGLPVEIRMQDYRDINDSFDRIVVVGMIEHVGFKNYKEFFQVVNRNLKNDGIFLLHTIGLNHVSMPRSERWLCTHIFANGCLPRPTDLTKATSDLFVIEDWHNFGVDYAKTLAAWRVNFAKNWSKLEGKYGDKFYRMWMFYLATCEAMFAARKAQLWQIVMSKDGLKGGYIAAR